MKVNFKKLRNSVESSIKQLEKPRQVRVAAIREYVGMHFASGGSEERVPTNFIELAVTIYTRQLAARAPRAMISTSVPSLVPYAKDMELAINQIPDEIFLGRTLRRAVIEAIFSLGIIKVGICQSSHIIQGHTYGEMFADAVTLDNYFLDMSAKRMEAIQYEGDDYWLPLDVARDMIGDSSLEADDHTTTGDDGGERAEGVSVDESVEMYGPRIHARDVWLPDVGQLVTYGVKSKEEFGVVDWDGPTEGPYRKLGFSDVPGNLLPLAPVQLMLDMHELANLLYRKLGTQAAAKKTVAAFGGDNEDSVKALQNAKDGGGIAYHGAEPKSLTVGGVDAETLAMFLQTKDLFTYFAGNLDSLGGLAPSTDTVGQDKMLSAAANSRMDFMKDQTVDFARSIFKDLAWYAWTDPVRERKIEKPVEGTDIILQGVWSQETRDGDFLDYNLDIDAYSMQNDTPTIRLAKIGQVFQTYVVPLLPQLEAQGGQIDIQALFAMIGKLSNLPELASLVKFQESPIDQQQPRGNSKPALQSPNTTRTYDRVVRPGASRHGKDAVMSQLLMGAKAQQGEADTLSRSVS